MQPATATLLSFGLDSFTDLIFLKCILKYRHTKDATMPIVETNTTLRDAPPINYNAHVLIELLYRYWSTENKHLSIPVRTQYPEKLNVWVELHFVFLQTVMGRHFFPVPKGGRILNPALCIRAVRNKIAVSQYLVFPRHLFFLWFHGQTDNPCKFKDRAMSQENFDLVRYQAQQYEQILQFSIPTTVPRLRLHRAAKGIALDSKFEPLQVSPIHKTFPHLYGSPISSYLGSCYILLRTLGQSAPACFDDPAN
ncbi:hypothetical protein NQ318_017056 [Aromia moschata]|uniref:Uncharacterized protein n=1 Tax=Aromia moschata TaxID=1265417 RepID=A0AAV8XCQ0_9CUCU|nr:hypothetical protein NQ318_017056 [Aromia moschata]